MFRPTWDKTWMDAAQVIAQRSRCDRRHVGAIVTNRDRFIASGYNGPPAGYPGEGGCGDWCPRAMTMQGGPGYVNCVAVHAEINALLFADRSAIEGGTLYVTAMPCWDCARAIANSGVSRVVFPVDWTEDAPRDPDRLLKFLDDSGLSFTVYEEKTNEAD